MIAVDTNVLFDLLFDGPTADASMLALGDALTVGPVVMCEVVVAELSSRGQGTELVTAVREMGIQFSDLQEKSAIRAGEMMHRYRQNGGPKLSAGGRAVPDFLIGAHALLQCNGLITLDAGFNRQYFKGLNVIDPLRTAEAAPKSI
jgi:predicted nucleic acid-binding protein